jgi:hypothetical protein
MKKVALIILDGWGLGDGSKSDAIANAKTPFVDSLYKKHPHSTLRTSGEHVGLPQGQMGNSEVGHQNIGAGRIVPQESVRISKTIRDGSFFENKEFVKRFREFAKKNKLPGGSNRVTDDPIFWGYVGLYTWKAAVEKAGTTDVDAVLKALPGLEIPTPAGKIVVDRRNHHTAKPVYIGRVLANGQFEIIWQSKGLVSPEPWSEYTYPERSCDWSKGGKGSFDVIGGEKIFLDPRALPIEPL